MRVNILTCRWKIIPLSVTVLVPQQLKLPDFGLIKPSFEKVLYLKISKSLKSLEIHK